MDDLYSLDVRQDSHLPSPKCVSFQLGRPTSIAGSVGGMKARGDALAG